MYDVVVVGGGPAGARVAQLVAEAGLKTLILERRKSAGTPVQCAGLISPRTFELLGREFSILNRVRGADIYSPGNRIIHIEAEKPKAIVIDRVGFDRELLEGAIASGAEARLGARLSAITRRNKSIRLFAHESDGKTEIDTELVVGADGPDSIVARTFNLPPPGKFLSAHGVEVGGCDLDPEHVKLFTGNDIAPHFFAWMIPTGEGTRIGLATDAGNASQYFPAYKKRLSRLGLYGHEKDVQYITGTIPIGPRQRTYADRAILVGDAAGQVKATTGGGIYMGMKCAHHAAAAAVMASEAGNFSEKGLSQYQVAWEADVGKELKTGYKLHRVYSRLKDRDVEEIFSALARPQILDIINNIGDIDYPSKLAFSILMKAPKLIKYVPKGLFTLASR